MELLGLDAQAFVQTWPVLWVKQGISAGFGAEEGYGLT